MKRDDTTSDFKGVISDAAGYGRRNCMQRDGRDVGVLCGAGGTAVPAPPLRNHARARPRQRSTSVAERLAERRRWATYGRSGTRGYVAKGSARGRADGSECARRLESTHRVPHRVPEHAKGSGRGRQRGPADSSANGAVPARPIAAAHIHSTHAQTPAPTHAQLAVSKEAPPSTTPVALACARSTGAGSHGSARTATIEGAKRALRDAYGTVPLFRPTEH